jgi:hypothetical protein
MDMYSIYVDGYYSGGFNTLGEAMIEIQKAAICYGHRWQVKDGHGKVVARG